MRVAGLALVLSALSLTKPAVIQSNPPKVLMQALHCAKTEHLDLLEGSLEKDGMVKASFTHYIQTEPTVDGLVVVIYGSPSNGEVLDYVREFDHGKVQLYLVNNATFSFNQNKDLSVVDALGGVWTQGHLKQRVKKAMRTTYSIPKSSLDTTSHNVGCHAPWNPD